MPVSPAPPGFVGCLDAQGRRRGCGRCRRRRGGGELAEAVLGQQAGEVPRARVGPPHPGLDLALLDHRRAGNLDIPRADGSRRASKAEYAAWRVK